MISARLRDARAALVADPGLRGRAFGEALTDIVDDALQEAYAGLKPRGDIAIVALGSYARRELCPASDIDVLLVHELRSRRHTDVVRSMTEQLWYPLWDAGFVTGHGARTVKDSVALADDDLDALTSLLEVRLVAGEERLARELETKVRELAGRRRDRMLKSLADGAELRRLRPGPVAEMLEPDVKEGAGGLRDLQSLGWAGWAFGEPGGEAALVAQGLLTDRDLDRVKASGELLLDVRVALQRTTTARSDRLALQEQDAVAEVLGFADADALVRELSHAAREVAWITSDVWDRVRDLIGGARPRDQVLAEGVELRDGRVHVASADGAMPVLRALEAAAAAAELDARFDRASLARLQSLAVPAWDVWERAAFLRLLRAGENAIAVFEALDHEGVLVQILPEWEHVRSRPQRNAYHRFTVDRHLLEAVAECARLLDAGDEHDRSDHDVDAVVARACRRPELLLLGALLHDIAKGLPGDHSEVGSDRAGQITRRMGLDSEGREIVAWLVRNHLLMADVATRRDLSDASVADNLARRCADDPERLRLLYLLTIGDSRATGPAAWSPSKAALVRDLFVKAAAAIERGEASVLAADRRAALVERIGEARAKALLDRLPEAYVLAFDIEHICAHEAMVLAGEALHVEAADGHVTVTVVARDRPGLLATLAGALTISGLDVLEANLFGTADGIALDVFRAVDPFGRVAEDATRVSRTIQDALAGSIDLAAKVDERRRAYEVAGPEPGPCTVVVDTESSETDTIVEVHADDDLGLLSRLAAAFVDLHLDVRVAKVATLGSRVVDVFYVRDGAGAKVADPAVVEKLRTALTAQLTH